MSSVCTIPAKERITRASRRRQSICRVECYGFGVNIDISAISIKCYCIIVRLPICRITSVSITTSRYYDTHRHFGKICSCPSDKRIAGASRFRERDISAFDCIIERICSVIRPVIQRIGNFISNGNRSSCYSISVGIVCPNRQTASRIIGNRNSVIIPNSVVSRIARKREVTVLINSLRSNLYAVFIQFKNRLVCIENKKFPRFFKYVTQSIRSGNFVDNRFIYVERTAGNYNVKQNFLAETVNQTEQLIRAITVLNIRIFSCKRQSRRIVNFDTGNKRALCCIAKRIRCNDVKVNRITASNSIIVGSFDRNSAGFPEPVYGRRTEFFTSRRLFDSRGSCRVVSQGDIVGRIDLDILRYD